MSEATHWTGAPGDCPSDPECQPRTEQEQAEREAQGCETCDGSGVVTFCPSVPDTCDGCEQAPCSDCRRAAVEPVTVPPGEKFENPFD